MKHENELLPDHGNVSEGHLSGITLTNSLLTLQHRIGSPNRSSTGIPLSQIGSSLANLSQKDQEEFN
jgi:hypothetical protein